MENQSQAILTKAKSYRDATAGALSRIVQVPALSGTEGDRIRLLEKMCKEAGADEVRIDGLGSLLARVGNGKKILAIDAHIDTVDIGDRDQWKTDPFSGIIKDGLVHGRGTSDQLGGAASMITAIRILKELKYSGEYSVWFTFTVMEEDCDGMCWKYLIEEEKFVPDFAVSTEPTSLRLYRGHRGRMEIECLFRGVSCHGSAPERGVSAAYKASRSALAMEKLNSELKPDDDGFLGKGTVVVSRMDAHGPSLCAVPDLAMIYLDRRLTWGETKELAVEQVRQALGNDLYDVRVPIYNKVSWKGTHYEQELYFPTWKIPADHPLVRGGFDAYRGLFGAEPVVDKWTFSTNGVAICGRHGIPLIGFGPGDENQAHAPNEMTRVDDLEKASAFYAALPFALEKTGTAS
ncbi:MAG TPA: YgeY family selenium metabolism-linked hydrolase [Spirochaetia bacterium]|nr:YgeY family selenium metabolism-linked hydrolase [Spirochaetia bacterium]